MARRSPEEILEIARAAQVLADDNEKVRVADLKNKRLTAIGRSKDAHERRFQAARVHGLAKQENTERKTSKKIVVPEMESAEEELLKAVEEEVAAINDVDIELKEIENDPAVLVSLEEEARREDTERTQRKKEDVARKERRAQIEKEIADLLMEIEIGEAKIEEQIKGIVRMWEQDKRWSIGFTYETLGYIEKDRALVDELSVLNKEILRKERELHKKMQKIISFGKKALSDEIASLKKQLEKVEKEREINQKNAETRRADKDRLMEMLQKEVEDQQSNIEKVTSKAAILGNDEKTKEIRKKIAEHELAKKFPFILPGSYNNYKSSSVDVHAMLKHYKSERVRVYEIAPLS